MPYMGSLEYFVVDTLNFVRANDTHGIKETWLRADDFGHNQWNSFNVLVWSGERPDLTEYVLAAERLTLGELVTFAMGADYARKVDFALPGPDASPYWLGWDYNNKTTFGEALTAQKVMAAYHKKVKAALG